MPKWKQLDASVILEACNLPNLEFPTRSSLTRSPENSSPKKTRGGFGHRMQKTCQIGLGVGVNNEMKVLRPSKDCWCYWFHPKLRIYVLETRKNLDEYRICFHRSARCSAHRCLPVGNGSEHGRPVAAQRWRGEGTKWPVDGTTGGWFAELTIEHGVKLGFCNQKYFFLPMNNGNWVCLKLGYTQLSEGNLWLAMISQCIKGVIFSDKPKSLQTFNRDSAVYSIHQWMNRQTNDTWICKQYMNRKTVNEHAKKYTL